MEADGACMNRFQSQRNIGRLLFGSLQFGLLSWYTRSFEFLFSISVFLFVFVIGMLGMNVIGYWNKYHANQT
jgi:hypothetical protein